MVDTHVLLSFARVLTSLLAGTISFLGFRAYARTRRASLLVMAGGAGLLALGYFLEGVLVEFLGWSLHDATVLESISTLAGATLLVVSLYLREPRRMSAPLRPQEAIPSTPR